MTIENIEIPTPDGPMPALAAHPPTASGSSPRRGAVIVIHEAFGLTDHIGDVVERMSEAGYRVVAPALFHRVDSPILAYDSIKHDEGLSQLIAIFESLNASNIATDVAATLAQLKTEGFEPSDVAMVGFCMGGAIALFATTRFPLACGVTFYGGGVATGRFGLASLIDLAPKIAAPWLGFYGDLDQSIPVDDVEDLREAARSAVVSTQIVRYASADHGFNCNDRPEHFNTEASDDAWAKMLEFFAVHIGA